MAERKKLIYPDTTLSKALVPFAPKQWYTLTEIFKKNNLAGQKSAEEQTGDTLRRALKAHGAQIPVARATGKAVPFPDEAINNALRNPFDIKDYNKCLFEKDIYCLFVFL